MSGAQPSNTALSHRFIFGANAKVHHNLSFSNDDTIAYVAGQTVVLYNLTDKKQRFLNGAEITDVLTCYESGPGKRLAAVAERGERPSVHIFDLRTFRRKKTLTASEGTSKEYVAIQFSEDDMLLMTLTGAPDWQLTVWNWQKARVMSSMSVSVNGDPIYDICFSPIDVTVCCCIGKEYIKFYRTSDKEMRLLHETHFPNKTFTTMAWMRHPEDHLLVGSEEGDILLFRAGQFVMSLPNAPGPRDGKPVGSITTIANGFIVGSQSAVYFYYYDEKADQALYDHQFQFTNMIETDLASGIIQNVALCPTEEMVCCFTSDSQILQLPIISPQSLLKDDIQYAVCSFHGPKSIISLDVCILKPLIITICEDFTLRIWNYREHKPDLVKVIPEDTYSVALSPNGLMCAVGFTDKLRMFHILVDDLRVCTELPIKCCKEVQFSIGGNLIAAANGNAINVYDCHSGEKVADLRGHNSKVRSLTWLENGTLLSCGQDGAVYLWEIEGGRRVAEYVQKGAYFTSVTQGSGCIFVVGNDRSIRELTLPELTTARAQDSGLLMGHCTLSTNRSALFAGSVDTTKPGTLRVYNYPLSGDYDDYPCGSTMVTDMRLTPDEHFIMTSDSSGCLSIFELRDRKDRFQRQDPTGPPEHTMLDTWNDEILVTLSELEEKNSSMMELHTKVEELKLHNEYQLKLKEMTYSEKLKEITDKFMQELEQSKTKLELLKEECADLGLEHEEHLRNLVDAHQYNVQEMETSFQSEIMDCVNAYQQLTRDRDAQLERLESQRRQLIQGHEKYVDELTRDYEFKLDEDRNTRLQCDDDKYELEKEMKEIQDQVEDDVDAEIIRLRQHYEEKLITSRETTLKYKGENSMMRKKYAVLQRELEDMKEETRQLLDKERELHESIKMLEKEVTAHKKEIKAKDVSTGEKEKKIYELKKKNQELDKFKFVLDFKIRELKQQIEPRQLEILRMRDKIKEMDDELERHHKSNANLDELIGAVRDRINDLHSDTKAKRSHAKQQENNIATIRSQLQMAIAFVLDPPKLKKSIEILAKEHGAGGPIKPRIDPDVESEYSRHREFLQRSVAQLKKYLEDGSHEHMLTNSQLMQQNLDLIENINKQREHNRNLKRNVQADIGRIRQMAQQRDIKNKKKVKTVAATGMNDAGYAIQSGTGTQGQGDIDPTMILERNRQRILALRAAIAELESRRTSVKATSILPPLESNQTGEPRIAFYTQAQNADQLQSPRANDEKLPADVDVDDNGGNVEQKEEPAA
jgi:cilia- and flagella-associated protein 57